MGTILITFSRVALWFGRSSPLGYANHRERSRLEANRLTRLTNLFDVGVAPRARIISKAQRVKTRAYSDRLFQVLSHIGSHATETGDTSLLMSAPYSLYAIKTRLSPGPKQHLTQLHMDVRLESGSASRTSRTCSLSPSKTNCGPLFSF